MRRAIQQHAREEDDAQLLASLGEKRAAEADLESSVDLSKRQCTMTYVCSDDEEELPNERARCSNDIDDSGDDRTEEMEEDEQGEQEADVQQEDEVPEEREVEDSLNAIDRELEEMKSAQAALHEKLSADMTAASSAVVPIPSTVSLGETGLKKLPKGSGRVLQSLRQFRSFTSTMAWVAVVEQKRYNKLRRF